VFEVFAQLWAQVIAGGSSELMASYAESILATFAPQVRNERSLAGTIAIQYQEAVRQNHTTDKLKRSLWL